MKLSDADYIKRSDACFNDTLSHLEEGNLGHIVSDMEIALKKHKRNQYFDPSIILSRSFKEALYHLIRSNNIKAILSCIQHFPNIRENEKLTEELLSPLEIVIMAPRAVVNISLTNSKGQLTSDYEELLVTSIHHAQMHNQNLLENSTLFGYDTLIEFVVNRTSLRQIQLVLTAHTFSRSDLQRLYKQYTNPNKTNPSAVKPEVLAILRNISGPVNTRGSLDWFMKHPEYQERYMDLTNSVSLMHEVVRYLITHQPSMSLNEEHHPIVFLIDQGLSPEVVCQHVNSIYQPTKWQSWARVLNPFDQGYTSDQQQAARKLYAALTAQYPHKRGLQAKRVEPWKACLGKPSSASIPSASTVPNCEKQGENLLEGPAIQRVTRS